MSPCTRALRSKQVVRTLAAALAVLATACGGGGGSGTSISVDVKSLAFGGRYDDALPAAQRVTVTYVGDGVLVGTPPGQMAPAWLSVTKGPTGPATAAFDVAVTQVNGVPLGAQHVTLRFVTGHADGSQVKYVDVPLTYTVQDGLSFSLPAVELTANAEEPSQADVAVHLAATGADVAWTATADAGLRLESVSGGPGAPLTVAYDTQAQLLAPGLAHLQVHVTALVGGESVTKHLPVTVEVGEHRMYAERNGVALTSVPGVDDVTAQVTLVDNAGERTGTWSAASDQGWLIVDGIQGDAVSIHAVPDGLGDGLHLATLSITSTGARLTGTERVRVGLYKASAAPIQGLLVSGISAYAQPIADPVRPWTWLVMTDRKVVRAYNVFSGALEDEVTFPADVDGLGVSGDGGTLYAEGIDAASSTHAVWPVDLDAGTALPAFHGLGTGGNGSGIVAVLRPGGREFLATREGEFFDAAAGTMVLPAGEIAPWMGWIMTASADSRHLYGGPTGGLPMPVYDEAATFMGATPALALQLRGGFVVDSGVNGLAVTPDGSAVCFPDLSNNVYADHAFVVYGHQTADALVPLGSFHGSNAVEHPMLVRIAPTGRVVTLSAVTGASTSTTLDAYGTLLGPVTHSVSVPTAIQTFGMGVSSDGERALLVGFTDDTYTTQALWGYSTR